MAEKAKKTKFSFAWKALTVIISLLILYTVYHIALGLSEGVATTPAGLVKQNSSVVLEGLIFRNEQTVKTQNGGAFRPYLSNGERVSVDMIVGAVYSKPNDENVNAEIENLQNELEIYKQSNVKGLVSAVDIEKLEAEIDKLYSAVMTYNAKGESVKAKSLENQLLIALNKMKIYEGKVKSYDADIDQTEKKLDVLYSSFKGEIEYISAEHGGYFYHFCDGYEEILTPELMCSLTLENLKKMTSDIRKNPVKTSGDICKFVLSSTWHIVTYCDNGTAGLLEEGKSYSATLFDIREREVILTLERIGESDGEHTILVFSCSTMPADFDYTRYQGVKLDISFTEGYRVPKQALVTLTDKESGEEKRGVYILSASVVYFKRVEIISEGEGYYIVSKLDRDNENWREYLNLNDLIILDPDGMYDGRVLKK